MIQIGNENEARERKVYQVHLLHVAEQEAFQDVVDFFGGLRIRTQLLRAPFYKWSLDAVI